MMRGVQILGNKTSPQVSFSTALPIPAPAGSEVLVKVSAAGITADEVSWPELYESNRIPGHDIAGTVASLGPDYKGSLKAGDEVFAMIRAATKAGGQADYVAVEGDELARKPQQLSMGEAAALPIPVLTAWEALHQKAEIKKGDKVLVTGASGSVGIMLVQIASKILGAEVIALASPKKHATLQTLGAAKCLDYHEKDWERSAGSVDTIIDTVGGEVYSRSWQCLCQGGTTITVADPPPPWAFTTAKPEQLRDNREAKYVYFIVTASGAMLEKTAGMFDSGKLKALSVVEFEAQRAVEAWKYGAQRGKEGKAVIIFS